MATSSAARCWVWASVLARRFHAPHQVVLAAREEDPIDIDLSSIWGASQSKTKTWRTVSRRIFHRTRACSFAWLELQALGIDLPQVEDLKEVVEKSVHALEWRQRAPRLKPRNGHFSQSRR